MCDSRFYAFMFCILFLTGCGENFSVGGVSLGGSGTGVGFPDVNPSPGDPKDAIVDPYGFKFYLKSSMPQIQAFPADPDCSGIRRSIQLENLETGKLAAEGDEVDLSEISAAKPNNIAVQVTVQNLTDKPIFEHIPACAAPVKLLDQDGNAVSQGANFSCSNGESLQAYAAGECRVFRYEFSLPQKVSAWSLNYNTRYTDINNIELNQCPSLSFNMNVETKKDDGVFTGGIGLIIPGMPVEDSQPCGAAEPPLTPP